MHESILAYRHRRYLWVALALSGACIAAYWFYDPQEPHNGGTPLGYVLGTLAAALILWLTWFGVRKRRYASTLGTVQGWLSAHVYLGLALLLVTLLHMGFQWGFNVHTLAFVLMSLVIASGIIGVVVYLRYPERMSENRDGAARAELLDQLAELDRRTKVATRDMPAAFGECIASGITRTQLGNTLWQRMQGKDRSSVALPSGKVVPNAGQEALMDWLAEQQSQAADADTLASIGELSGLLRNKRKLLRKLQQDLKLQAAIEVWLYAHVPLTFGLLVALAVHILVVFLYW